MTMTATRADIIVGSLLKITADGSHGFSVGDTVQAVRFSTTGTGNWLCQPLGASLSETEAHSITTGNGRWWVAPGQFEALPRFEVGQRVRVTGRAYYAHDLGVDTIGEVVETVNQHRLSAPCVRVRGEVSGQRQSIHPAELVAETASRDETVAGYASPLGTRPQVGEHLRITNRGSHGYAVGATVVVTYVEDDTTDRTVFCSGDIAAPPVEQRGGASAGYDNGGTWWVTDYEYQRLGKPVAAPPAKRPAPSPTGQYRVVDKADLAVGDLIRVIGLTSAGFSIGNVVRVIFIEGTDVSMSVMASSDLDARPVSRVSARAGGRQWWITPSAFERVVADETTATGSEDVETLRRERDEAQRALRTFRAAVRRVATTEAATRGWCSEIDEVLAKIEPDLKRLSQKARIKRTIEVEIEIDDIHLAGARDCNRNADVDLAGKIDPTWLLDGCFMEGNTRVRLISATLNPSSDGQVTQVAAEEEDVDVPDGALTADDGFPLGTELVVLPGARRAPGQSPGYRVPTVGTRVTVSSSGVDGDGEVAVRYDGNSDRVTHWTQPQYLRLATPADSGLPNSNGSTLPPAF